MTDLIKRLRGRSQFCKDRGEVKSPDLMNEAADRIEELENSLAWYQKMDAMCSDHVVELTDKLEAAEDKLIKAMAFIRRHIPDSVYEQRQRANAFLAELEGKDHG